MSAERTGTLRIVSESETIAPSRENIAAIAHGADVATQLLCTAVITLMDEVKRLKQKVGDLEGREVV